MSHSVKGTKVYEMFKAHLKAHNFKFDPHDDDLVITLTNGIEATFEPIK